MRSLSIWFFPAALLGSIFAYVRLRNSLITRAIDLAFARHQFEDPTLHTVNERLLALNQEGPFTFAGERRANILFRGQPLTLVYGRVTHPAGRGGWGILGSVYDSPSKTVFALVDRETAEWLRENPTVFKEAFMGTRFGVFWVTLARLTPNQAMERTADRSASTF